jgi:SAM-dependent methyltransferase
VSRGAQMLEISEYRYAEAAAKAQIRSWWVAQTHHVDHFERSGFPVRPNHFFEIGQLLDTMQENRHASFMKELDGLGARDLELIINALVQSIEFQLIHFPRREPLLPISTMLSSLVLYKKIAAACDRPRVLEVGPGCGYLSFFLAQDAGLKEYAQVEAAESFYLLQNRVNAHCFGSGFLDLAHQFDRADYSFTSRTEMERGVALDDKIARHVKCSHFPWWMLGLLHERGPVYDVVTSNANLNEFSRPALKDYLSIFGRVLKPDGVFIVQCTGFTALGRSRICSITFTTMGLRRSLLPLLAPSRVRPRV